jgi:hypothetical protein
LSRIIIRLGGWQLAAWAKTSGDQSKTAPRRPSAQKKGEAREKGSLFKEENDLMGEYSLPCESPAQQTLFILISMEMRGNNRLMVSFRLERSLDGSFGVVLCHRS